jgi:hypothetical protein
MNEQVLDPKDALGSLDIGDEATFNVLLLPLIPINLSVTGLICVSDGTIFGQATLLECERNLAHWPLRETWQTHAETISPEDFPSKGSPIRAKELQTVVCQRLCLDKINYLDSFVDHPHNIGCPKTDVALVPCVQFGELDFDDEYINACLTGQPAYNCTLKTLWIAPDISRPCFAGSCLVECAGGVRSRIDILKPGDQVLTTDGSLAHVDAVWCCSVANGTKVSMVKIGRALVTYDHPVAMPSGLWGYAESIGEAKPVQIGCLYNLFTSPPGPVIVDGLACATLGHSVSGCEDLFWGTHRVRDAMAVRHDWPQIATEFQE